MSRTKKALILVCILVFLFFVGKTIRMVKASVWDGRHHINIAIDNEDVEIWSIEPATKTVSKIFVPKDTVLTLPRYGDYKAGSVGRFSVLERKNEELLKHGLMETFGIPIDGAIVRKEENASQFPLSDFFGLQALPNMFLSTKLAESYLTDLTFFDMIRLWFFSFSIRKEGIEKVEIVNLDVLEKTMLPDGGEVFVVDRDRFAILAKKYFSDSAIEEEQATIEVLNGSNVEGRATRISQVLQNIGGTVINTGKNEKQEDKSWVFSKKKNYTVLKISKIVDGSYSASLPKETRADILVVLGGSQ